ncbi:MAG TPA: hypothetical protein VFZ89_06160, partial [Solirubrobacteraceae bacterium]
MIERDRQRVAYGLHSSGVVAVLGPGHALEAKRSEAQIEALGTVGLLHRVLRELDRVAMLGGHSALVGHHEQFHGGGARIAVGRECLRR